MSREGAREPIASDPNDDRVSRELLQVLREDEATPPRTLATQVLARVRRLLGLRELFDGIAVGPFRIFATALRRESHASDAPDESGARVDGKPRTGP